MSIKEFIEWGIYDELDPGNPERGDVQAALICQTIYHMLRGKKSKPKPLKDFLLNFHIPEKKSVKELKTKFTFWKTMFDAQQKRKKKREDKLKEKLKDKK